MKEHSDGHAVLIVGIGRAMALAFAHEGARVVVSGRHNDDGGMIAS